MLKEFQEYLKTQVARPSIYVLGAQGQHDEEITEAWIKYREHYIAYNYKRAIELWKEKLAQGYTDIAAYDCSGLGMEWIYDQNKLTAGDKTANGMWAMCERISFTDLRSGDWVFKGTALRKSHIGYVINPALDVIESKGRDWGVLTRPLNFWDSTTKYWQYAGRPKIFKDEILANIPLPPVVYPVLRYGDEGEFVKILQALLNKKYASTTPLVVDGKFGSKTLSAVKNYQLKNGLVVDGIVGIKTWTSLRA